MEKSKKLKRFRKKLADCIEQCFNKMVYVKDDCIYINIEGVTYSVWASDLTQIKLNSFYIDDKLKM